MKGYYKRVMCKLGTYRIMGEDKPALHKVLEHTYLEALHEARDIITHLFNTKEEKKL